MDPQTLKKILLGAFLTFYLSSTLNAQSNLELVDSAVLGTSSSSTISGGNLVATQTFIGFLDFLNTTEAGNLTVSTTFADADEASTVLALDSDFLPYPNPLRLAASAHLYYKLTIAGDLTLHIYDSFGRRIVNKALASGEEGGRQGLNQVPINGALFNNYPLSAGVYFAVLIHEGQVLDKTKIAIVP